jgi:carboxymethylenebutenolidase
MRFARRLLAVLLLPVAFSGLAGAAKAEGHPGQDIVLATTQGNVRVRYFPAPGQQQRPSVLLFHGAGGIDHDAVGFAAYTTGLNARGIDAYVVFYYSDADTKLMTSPDHAVRSNTFVARYRNWVQESREIISFVLSRPTTTGRLGLMGFSNGATLSTGIATNEPRVNALVDFYGSFPPDRIRRLPPTLILHGAADKVIPVSDAQKLETLVRSLGAPVQITIYPNEPHGFDMGPKGTDARQRAFQFLQTYLR